MTTDRLVGMISKAASTLTPAWMVKSSLTERGRSAVECWLQPDEARNRLPVLCIRVTTVGRRPLRVRALGGESLRKPRPLFGAGLPRCHPLALGRRPLEVDKTSPGGLSDRLTPGFCSELRQHR